MLILFRTRVAACCLLCCTTRCYEPYLLLPHPPSSPILRSLVELANLHPTTSGTTSPPSDFLRNHPTSSDPSPLFPSPRPFYPALFTPPPITSEKRNVDKHTETALLAALIRSSNNRCSTLTIPHHTSTPPSTFKTNLLYTPPRTRCSPPHIPF